MHIMSNTLSFDFFFYILYYELIFLQALEKRKHDSNNHYTEVVNFYNILRNKLN